MGKMSIVVGSVFCCLSFSAHAQYYPVQPMMPVQPVMPIQPMQPMEPTQMTTQRLGNQTFYNGQVNGQQINGDSQTIGNQTFSHFNGPDGQMTNCTTQYIGNQAFTNCN